MHALLLEYSIASITAIASTAAASQYVLLHESCAHQYDAESQLLSSTHTAAVRIVPDALA
jgi:hypothetical protein